MKIVSKENNVGDNDDERNKKLPVDNNTVNVRNDEKKGDLDKDKRDEKNIVHKKKEEADEDKTVDEGTQKGELYEDIHAIESMVEMKG